MVKRKGRMQPIRELVWDAVYDSASNSIIHSVIGLVRGSVRNSVEYSVYDLVNTSIKYPICFQSDSLLERITK